MIDRPPVSAIVVSYGTRELTLTAVESLVAFLPEGSEIWVVDNASADDSAAAVRAGFPQVNVIELSENVGFGPANNVAMERAAGEYFLLLNSDARLIDAETLPKMMARLQASPRLAVVGPRLESPDGRFEYSARSFPTVPKELVRRLGLYLVVPRARVGGWLLGDFWSPLEPAEVDWVTGACMLVRRAAYDDVGGFDPRLFMYGEEQEWCRRIGAGGWGVLYDPSVTVVHARAASGPPGPWRVRAALRADAQIIRWARGPLRALAFNLARALGLVVESSAFAVAAAVRRSDYMRRRREHAALSRSEQLKLTFRRPFG
jgi:N-acetylglucosaminyl-diphospho-decaprenol L-rhamnosyltransferase